MGGVVTDHLVEKIMDFGFGLENQCYDREDLRQDAVALAAEARAAEHDRILSPEGFDASHGDGSIGPAQLPPEYATTDAAYWYRRWLFLARMLDEEAGARLDHYREFNRKLLGAPDAARSFREYGQQMSGGGWDIWNTSDEVLKVYPLAKHIENIQRHGGVYRRTIIVVQDWKRLRKGAKS